MSVTLTFGQVVGLSKKKKLYRNSPMSVCHLSTFFSPKKKKDPKNQMALRRKLKAKTRLFSSSGSLAQEEIKNMNSVVFSTV